MLPFIILFVNIAGIILGYTTPHERSESTIINPLIRKPPWPLPAFCVLQTIILYYRRFILYYRHYRHFVLLSVLAGSGEPRCPDSLLFFFASDSTLIRPSFVATHRAHARPSSPANFRRQAWSQQKPQRAHPVRVRRGREGEGRERREPNHPTRTGECRTAGGGGRGLLKSHRPLP